MKTEARENVRGVASPSGRLLGELILNFAACDRGGRRAIFPGAFRSTLC